MLLKRTHTCGELTRDHVGQAVVLNGWVDAWRDFGGLVFIDLRDRYGVTQVVFEPDAGAELQARARELRNEYVIGIKGTVAPRLPGKENPKLKTGAIEVRAVELVLYNATPTPPFEMHGPEPNEELRLKYRFLDLRRPEMQRIFILRHEITQLMRKVMSEQGFLEVETPILGRSTPEGRPRLPRPQPGPRRALLRPAAISPALQAAPDGLGLRPLLPDRPLLPRRGPARQPPARVHPARRRDVVRRGPRRHVHDGDLVAAMARRVRRHGARRSRFPGSSTTT